MLRTGQLPADIRFKPNVTTEFPDDMQGLGTERSTEQALRNAGANAVTNWSSPIVFEPSGRSRDANIVISGARGFAITVTLRGLTGSVAWSQPVRETTQSTMRRPTTREPSR